MNFKCTVAVFLLMVVLMFATDSTNGFRKPPFNGSIFGKRTISYPGTLHSIRLTSNVVLPTLSFEAKNIKKNLKYNIILCLPIRR